MTISPAGPPIARGRTAEIYAWHNGTILKLFYNWCPLSSVRHEIEIGRSVAATSLPAPKLRAVVEVDGRPGIIFERVDGPSMLNSMTSKPWLLTKYARRFAALHAHVHERSGAGFPPLRPSLRATIEQTEALPPQTRDRSLEALRRLPDGTMLCHMDFHPDQILLSPRGPRIIDWVTTSQGPPAADVARTLLLFQVGEPPHGSRMERVIINGGRDLVAQTYLAHYLHLRREISKDDVRAWLAPLAAARMSEGIAGEQQRLLDIIEGATEKQ